MREPGARSTPELVADAVDDVLTLVRHEVELAKAGVIENVLERLKGGGLIALAGLVLLPGALMLMLALALALPFSPQTGFFLVALVLLGLGGGGIWWGWRLLKRGGEGSKEALDAVKEDVRWARGLLKR